MLSLSSVEHNLYCIQCWGKLLLKVMHYSIALFPKKVTNYLATFYGKLCITLLLSYFLNMGGACLFVFNIKSSALQM